MALRTDRKPLKATLRTCLSKVGVPAAPVGLQARDITIAQALKPFGYATGQFGKNHLAATFTIDQAMDKLKQNLGD